MCISILALPKLPKRPGVTVVNAAMAVQQKKAKEPQKKQETNTHMVKVTGGGQPPLCTACMSYDKALKTKEDYFSIYPGRSAQVVKCNKNSC